MKTVMAKEIKTGDVIQAGNGSLLQVVSNEKHESYGLCYLFTKEYQSQDNWRGHAVCFHLNESVSVVS